MQDAAYALRVAIVGSGPAGFYAAERLFRAEKQGVIAHVDMLERLPTPFGLVRGGVAPDHQRIKSVTKVYDRIASHERFDILAMYVLEKMSIEQNCWNDIMQ